MRSMGFYSASRKRRARRSSPRDGKILKFDTHGDPINAEYIFRTERQGDRLVNTLIGQVPSINMDDYLK